MICQRRQDRGKVWTGSDPICGFDSPEQVFDSDNWNCATLNEIRDLVKDQHFSEDHNLGVLETGDIENLEGGNLGFFLVVGWYKRRGRTDSLAIWDSGQFHIPTLAEIEAILDAQR